MVKRISSKSAVRLAKVNKNNEEKKNKKKVIEYREKQSKSIILYFFLFCRILCKQL